MAFVFPKYEYDSTMNVFFDFFQILHLINVSFINYVLGCLNRYIWLLVTEYIHQKKVFMLLSYLVLLMNYVSLTDRLLVMFL